MKIRTKILGGFMIMALVTVIVGVTGLLSTMKLDSIATELHKLQLESDSVSRVLNAHYGWRQALTESVLTGNQFKGSLDPNSCALGQWYNSDEAKNMNDPELLNMLTKLDAPHEVIHREAKTVVALIEAGDLQAAQVHLENVIFPKATEVISSLTSMQSRYTDIVEAKDAESIRLANFTQIINIALIIISVIICVFLGFYISNLISKPLVLLAAFMKKAGSTGDITLTPADVDSINRLAKSKDELGQAISGSTDFIKHVTLIAGELESIASGDLTHNVKLLSDEDVMGRSLKQMTDNLNNMFSEINASTNQVSTGAKQVANGAQALAQGATEQAASIEGLSSSITEIAKMTKANAATADKTAKLSATIKENAETGSRQMDEMITAVAEINDASKNISKIIKTIDDIAFQTNILALNAAVEAARAGQHGKGFAVVAEEVRNLASKSAEAAKETGDMIQNSMEKAELGSRIAGETAASLSEIVNGINESSQLVTEIAQASEEQSLGIGQINTGIDQVAQVVQQNSATAEESAAASEEMSGQSDMLHQLIAQFKLKESNAITAHIRG